MNTGIQTQANQDRELISPVNLSYARYPVRTHLVQIGESYMNVVKDYAVPHAEKGDFLVMSEKMVAICQKRVVHESTVEASWLAKLICKFVTKYPDDVGFENPLKMQVAINEAGFLRMIFAVVIGGVMKFIFRRPGWFYRIAGNQINAIDGFNPIAIPPFNEYAILGPADPHKVCNQIEDKFDLPAVIVDASNIATNVLGKSDGIKHADTDLQDILAENPMGQGREQTPILLVRRVNNED